MSLPDFSTITTSVTDIFTSLGIGPLVAIGAVVGVLGLLVSKISKGLR